jgi:hypothetical protein
MQVRMVVVPKLLHMGFVEQLRLRWLEIALRRGWDIERDGRTFGGITEVQARRIVAAPLAMRGVINRLRSNPSGLSIGVESDFGVFRMSQETRRSSS